MLNNKLCLILTSLALVLPGHAALAGSLPTMGTAGNYAVAALGNGKTIGMNSGPIIGDVFLGNGIQAAFSGGGGGMITGTLYYDNTVTGTNTFTQLATPPLTQQVATSLTLQVLTDAQNASAAASALAATQTFTTITTATTISGNGGVNVINVTSINNAPLTLSGTKNDIFIFNVSDSINTNKVMTLTGGVDASHILFNLTGTGTVLQTSNGDVLFGTYLATNGGRFQFSNLELTGALINTGGDVQFVSGSDMTFKSFQATPEPSTMLLAIVGLGGLLVPGFRARWWRRKN